MINKSNGLGKKMTKQDMKKVKGGGDTFAPSCIPLGAPCGGGGCDEPEPVCCGYKSYCTGQNGLISIVGTCVV